MAKGKQISDKLRSLIIMEYASNRNYRETGRVFNMSEATVRSIIKNAPEELEVYAQKLKDECLIEAIDFKKEFLKRAEESIQKAVDLSQQRIELALVAHEKFDTRIDEILELLKDGEVNFQAVSEILRSLSSVMNVPLKDLSTFIGTMYDKRALSVGLPTAINNNLNTNENTQTYDLSHLSVEELKELRINAD